MEANYTYFRFVQVNIGEISFSGNCRWIRIAIVYCFAAALFLLSASLVSNKPKNPELKIQTLGGCGAIAVWCSYRMSICQSRELEHENIEYRSILPEHSIALNALSQEPNHTKSNFSIKSFFFLINQTKVNPSFQKSPQINQYQTKSCLKNQTKRKLVKLLSNSCTDLFQTIQWQYLLQNFSKFFSAFMQWYIDTALSSKQKQIQSPVTRWGQN